MSEWCNVCKQWCDHGAWKHPETWNHGSESASSTGYISERPQGILASGSEPNLVLPGMETESVRADDIIITPRDVAKDIIEFFQPAGRLLDPCRGDGAFADEMPGCEWCEIRDGRDFFGWTEPVDWIVSNPPYSIFSEFMRHSMRVAENIVYLIPVNKVFNSDRMMREVWKWGGVETIYVVSSGGQLGFPIGFAIGAVHFRRRYRYGAHVVFRNGAVAPAAQKYNARDMPRR